MKLWFSDNQNWLSENQFGFFEMQFRMFVIRIRFYEMISCLSAYRSKRKEI